MTAGQTATFTAAASGNPTPTVQWQSAPSGSSTFTNISGATSTTLTVASTTAAQNGNQYRAVFTNSVGSATTSTATLTVQFAPTVTTNPATSTVTGGDGHVHGGGLGQSDADGAVAGVHGRRDDVHERLGGDLDHADGRLRTTAQSGNQYRAVFTNSIGTATSTAATLTVTAAPFAPIVSTNPSSVTVTPADRDVHRGGNG